MTALACLLGLSKVAFASTNSTNNRFVVTTNALSAAIQTLNKEPNVAGASLIPTRQAMFLFIRIKQTPIPEKWVSSIIQSYLTSARSWISKADGNNFLTSFAFEANVYQDNSHGKLLFVGIKDRNSKVVHWEYADEGAIDTPISAFYLLHSTRDGVG